MPGTVSAGQDAPTIAPSRVEAFEAGTGTLELDWTGAPKWTRTNSRTWR